MATASDKKPISQSQLARYCGVSQPSVHAWVKNGCPLTSLEDALEWRKQQTGKDPNSIAEAKLKKVKLETDLLDLKIQQQKGELVSRTAMREAGQRVGALIVAELAAMANDAPGQLAGADEATIRERLEARHVVLVNRLRTAIGEIETVGIEQ